MSHGMAWVCRSTLLLTVHLLPLQGCVPFWPSVLSQLTDFSDGSTAAFVAATGMAERVCNRLLATPPDGPYNYM